MFTILANTKVDSDEIAVGRSIRLRSNVSANLNRTPASNGNRQKWTWSGWVKRGTLGTFQNLMGAGTTSPNYDGLRFTSSNTIAFYLGGAVSVQVSSAEVFRDVSAFYHVHLAVDTTKTLASERVRIAVGGRPVALSGTFPALDELTTINSGSVLHNIGDVVPTPGLNLDGHLTEVQFIDGEALPFTATGQIDPATGQWVPRVYSGNYGANGYYLNFRNGASLATIGYDSTANSNHWVATNLSLTAGTTYDWMKDHPTNNFATWNAASDALGTGVVSGGGLAASATNSQGQSYGTFEMSAGKWYWEVTCTLDGAVFREIFLGARSERHSPSTVTVSYFGQTGLIQTTGGGSATGGTFTTGDVIGIALDATGNTCSFYRNGTLQGTVPIPTARWVPFYIGNGTNSNQSSAVHANFGQQPFQYTPPTGYKSLCTANLPEPAIVRPEAYFKARTYIGNGASLQVGEIQKAIDLVTISQSLRFSPTDGSYLHRTPSVTGDRRTWTLASWMRRSNNGLHGIFTSHTGTGDRLTIAFQSDKLFIYHLTAASVIDISLTSTEILNGFDWGQLVIRCDTTQAVATNRVIAEYQGLPLTLTGTFPVQNFQTRCNLSGTMHRIGDTPTFSAVQFDGYMADIHFVDGQSLPSTAFGQWDANGYWVPKTYSGSYGTNGFQLTYADSSAATAAALGKDTSGNGNNWTPNGFSVTAGPTLDVLADSPTNTYAVLLPGDAGYTITNGGMSAFSTTTPWKSVLSSLTLPVSGKFCFEYLCANGAGGLRRDMIGVLDTTYPVNIPGSAPNSIGYLSYNGNIGGFVAPTWDIGDTVQCAIDCGTGQVWFGKNGVWNGDPVAGTGEATTLVNTDKLAFAVSNSSDGTLAYSLNGHVNFGQRPFTYAAPSGFFSLCENNVAEYTYDVEKPDLVWIKSRSATTDHQLFDTARGAGKTLCSNNQAAEVSDVNSLRQFNKNGFYLGNNANINALNGAYTAWTWKKGVTPGFDTVTYTGDGSATRVLPHSLGKVPAFIITKARSEPWDWYVKHQNLNADSGLVLNSVGGQSTRAVGFIAGFVEDPASAATFTLVSGSLSSNNVNKLNTDYITYLFAEVPGFSRMGTYTGNGSADGPFIQLGFKPVVVMLKRIDASANWYIYDTARGGTSGNNAALYPNASSMEASAGSFDLNANGLKIRTDGPEVNGNGGQFIFVAFAESPFKYSNAR